MRILRNTFLALLAVIVLGGCYVGSMVLGWFLALLAVGGIVFIGVLGVLSFITYALQKLWQHAFSSKE